MSTYRRRKAVNFLDSNTGLLMAEQNPNNSHRKYCALMPDVTLTLKSHSAS